jgi:hypothetical protein
MLASLRFLRILVSAQAAKYPFSQPWGAAPLFFQERSVKISQI